MAERNNSDALNELMNGIDNEKGIADLLDDKLDKNANAVSATKLANARTIQTNLSSTNSASFDGTSNVTPGVSGTLPVANGGTGQTNLANVTVGAATKATQDSAGNNIVNTYAKKSDIPSDVLSKEMTFSSSSSGTFWKVTDSAKNTVTQFIANNDFQIRHEIPSAGIIYIRLDMPSGSANAAYIFKSDGIYLNGTKITN